MLEAKFEMLSKVYHRMDPEPRPGLVVRIIFSPGGSVAYGVQWNSQEDGSYYEEELSDSPVYNHDEEV